MGPSLETLGLDLGGGNVPPQALDAEETVLGAMLLEQRCVDEGMEDLTPECFYDPKHRTIFEAISALISDHSAVDLITVTNQLRAMGKLQEIGGPVALANLTQTVAAAANMEFHVGILKQKTIQRDLIAASYNILRLAYDNSVKVDMLVDRAQSDIYAAIQNNVKREVRDVGSIMNKVMNDLSEMQKSDGLPGVPSGFPKLDSVTQGWQPSDLIILAARPSVGKTAFALNLARNAAVDHHMPVAFFSLEMSAEQLCKRLMTSESGLDSAKIKGGVKLEYDEWTYLEQALQAIVRAPLYIDDTPGIPLMEFRTKAKSLVKNKGVRIIFVDYLQLMQGPTELRGMREQEVAAISRTLKATAKELNVPVIALSQLSRNAVQRQGGQGRPQLSDLRESGSIEQDADMVIFIHRPDAIGLSENPDERDLAEIILAKHRNGETGEIEMRFRGEQAKFIEKEDTLEDQSRARLVQSAMNPGYAPQGTVDEFTNSSF